MRPKLLRLFFFILISLQSLNAFSQPCNMQGVYTVGPTGAFTNLTTAIAALRTTGVGDHVILELQNTYTSVGETFPITFDNIPCIDISRTITIRPQAGATNTIASSNSIGTIDLNNARYIRLDGRPGGAGSSNQLTISNTNVSGTAIRFINDASWNRAEYLNILGVNTSASGGVVSFLTTNQSITNGNSNNIIANCLITKGATTPINCIYGSGTAGKKNVNNQVNSCNIADFYAANGGTYGIKVGANNNYWQITGNSIYQTTQKNFVSSQFAGIYVNDTTSSAFVISNNFIGGSAPQCAGTKIIYGSFYNSIFLMLGDSAYTSIQNNTIANIGLTIELSGGYCAAIYMGMGKFKCGDEAGNSIGSQTVSNSISLGIRDFFEFYGIVAGTGAAADTGTDTCIIRNNRISGIQSSLINSADIYNGPIYGIYVRRQKRGYATVANNIIGDPGSAIGISNNTYSDANVTIGIAIETDVLVPLSLRPENNIINNTIVNLYGKAVGIKANNGNHKVVANTIKNFQNLAQSAGTALSLEGIAVSGGTINTVVTANMIHSFFCNGTNNTVNGISVLGSSGSVISRNFVHSLQTITAPTNNINGIRIVSGNNHRILNNMVRLGLDTAGNPLSGNQLIFGLLLDVDSAYTSNNTILIAGNGTNPSAALIVTGSLPKPVIINNILVNTRFTSSGTNKNYAIRFETPPLTKPAVNYNLYFASGNLSFLGKYQGTDYTNIISWRNGFKADSNSIFYDPNFINPSGGRDNINLHLNNPTPAEGTGTNSVFITDDIDGEIRAGLSPVDIGADAGNFTYQDGDAPILTHEAFLGQPATVLFTYKVKITDNGSGVDTAGANKPKMWFRKKFPSTSTWKSVAGSLFSGVINGGIWNFTPDYAVAGISVNPGDSIEYYFVAQDKGIIPNIGYSNLPGTQHSNVNTQISPPTIPLRYLIFGYFPDTVYVGTGQAYTSLTNAGGFFEASHFNIFDTTQHNHAIIITSNLLVESGAFDYTSLFPYGPDIFMVTNTPTVKVIRNNVDLAGPMIRLTKTANLKIDGNVNGSGKYLRFINARSFTLAAGTPVLTTGVYAHRLSIKNCIFESNSSNPIESVVLLASGYKKQMIFTGNIIRNIEPGGSDPGGLISLGLIIGADGSDSMLVKNNEIINFSARGLRILNGPSDDLLVDSNHFYHNSVIQPTGSRYVIDINADLWKTIVSNNFIGGSDKYCGGTPWTFSAATSNTTFNGIRIYEENDTLTPLSIQGNVIRNIRFTNFGYEFSGIYCTNGTLSIGTEKGNEIGSPAEDSSILNFGVSYGIYGVIAIGTPISVRPLIRIENNKVNGITSSLLTGVYFETKRAIIKNNAVSRLRASGNHFAKGLAGLICWQEEGVIEKNLVDNLICNFGDPASTTGISVAHTGTPDLVIARNRVSGLETNAPSSSVIGINTGGGKYIIHNNQVNLTNGSNSQETDMRGINLNGYGGPARISKVYYNSVRIGGTTSLGGLKSYAVYINQNFPISQFRNNLLYNERTGGTGQHLALGLVSGPNPPFSSWPASNSTNNYFVTADTAVVNEWRTSGVVGISQWRIVSQGDTVSYASNVTNVPAGTFFASLAAGNLNINNLDPLCWNVNGKGIPVPAISADFDSSANIRSTSVVTGATDIGADEFTTGTLPPAMIVTGSHANGGTENVSFNARTIANIQWGAAGTLPSLGTIRYYSGVWPNDTSNNNMHNGSRYLNTYWDIPATGGNNYTYNLTLQYDSSILGKVTNQVTMLVNKKQTGVPGSWQVVQPTMHNPVVRNVTVAGQTSFSEFTITDSLATLATGASLPDLLIANLSVTPATISTGNSFTANFMEVNNGYLAAAANKVRFYLSVDSILTPGANGDTLVGFYDIINPVNAQSNSGPLSKQLTTPCSLTPGQYYLLSVADALGNVSESNETNNIAAFAVTVTLGLTSPAIPVITSTPGATGCAPATINLTANSPGCNSCSYNWSNNMTGTMITVSNSGYYAITVSNACGNATNGQLVTITPVPTVVVTPGQSTICLGSGVSLTASGATTYVWSGPGLNATTGSVVTATPTATGNIMYSVTGTTNGCSQTTFVTITVNAVPTVSVSANPSSICLGSSTTLSATGATTYSWTGPGLGATTGSPVTAMPTGVGNAVYTVTGTSNGCSNNQSVTVTVNAVPTVSVLANPSSICLGSSTTLSATGATTYSWTGPGLNTTTGSPVTGTPTVLGNAVYTVTGTSNGCSNNQSVTVTVNAIPTLSVSANPTSICLGSSTTLSATGATTYSWTGPGLNTTTGSPVTGTPTVVGNAVYSVTGTSNGCSNNQSVTIPVSPTVIPSVTISYTGCPSTTLNFQAIAVNGGASPQFEWQVNSVTAGTGSTFILNNAVNGTQVNCIMTSAATCANPVVVSASETISCIVTSVPNIQGIESYYVAPNPTTGEFRFWIKLRNRKIISMHVYDITGKLICNFGPFNWIGENTKQFDLTRLAAGIYLFKVFVDKQYFTDKIIKIR